MTTIPQTGFLRKVTSRSSFKMLFMQLGENQAINCQNMAVNAHQNDVSFLS